MRFPFSALAFSMSRGKLPGAAVVVALMSCLYACGEECLGYTSFTDENGLIVFVACDGTTFVATPTPGSAVSTD